MPASGEDALAQLLDLLNGHAVVRALAVAADLGVPDRLAGGPLPVGTLAGQVGADADALLRVMRALAAVGVFAEAGPETFALSPLSERLRSDVPGSLRDYARLRGGRMYWQAWAELPHAVATGEAAFAPAHGLSHFAHLERHLGDARLFDAGMHAFSSQIQDSVLAACDFSRFGSVTDVGGGRGGLLAAILDRHPGLQGVLLERPSVARDAAAALAGSPAGDRIRIVEGDFFESVPEGSGAVLLSRVLHNWGDDDCLRILANCRAALPEGGRLILAEFILSDGPGGRAAKLFDLQMLVLMGGRERTEAELDRLVRGAGFEPRGMTATASGISVYEAAAA